jgi:ABC-type glycerol-3-phosphate transport system substrate-binding protein
MRAPDAPARRGTGAGLGGAEAAERVPWRNEAGRAGVTRRWALTWAAGAGAAAAATGCAGPSSQAPATSRAPVQLSLLWVTRPGEETLWTDEYPRLLGKQHPHIRTTLEMVPATGDYWAGLLTKVVSLTAAGTPPDASRNAGFNARQLLKSGMLKDLAGATKTARYPFAQHFAAAFPPHLKSADGKIYGLPVSILTVVRYVNKSALTQIGLKAPADWSAGPAGSSGSGGNWMLAQLQENARRLSRGAGAERSFGMRMQMNTMHGSHWFWTNGAEVIDAKGAVRINEAPAIDTLQYGLEYYTQQLSPSADDLRATPLNTLFTSGRLVMFDASQSSIPAIENAKPVFEWGVMPTSIGKSGKPLTVQFVDFWYVHAQSKHADAAYQAIEVLNGEDFETAMARNLTGGIPTLKAVAQKFTKDLFKVDPEVSLASLNFSREPYYAVKHLDWQGLVDRHAAALWAGQVSARQAAENIVRESQAILAEDKG